jgi:hypothetical protein
MILIHILILDTDDTTDSFIPTNTATAYISALTYLFDGGGGLELDLFLLVVRNQHLVSVDHHRTSSNLLQSVKNRGRG